MYKIYTLDNGEEVSVTLDKQYRAETIRFKDGFTVQATSVVGFMHHILERTGTLSCLSKASSQSKENDATAKNEWKRPECIRFFLKTTDYKSMDTDILIDELNRFLDGNLK